jgi:tyrosine-protein kinase Etk/Wzc
MSHVDSTPPDLRQLSEAHRLALPHVQGTGLQPATREADAFDGAGGLIDWRRIGAAVMRFKWIVALVAVLGTAAGFVLTRFLDPTYAARATLWVDVPDVRSRDQGPIQSGQLVGSSGWVDLLESHIVLDDVVRELRLYLSVERPADRAALATFAVTDRVRPGTYRLGVARGGEQFTLTTQAGDTLQRGGVGDSIGAHLGFAWQPPAAALPPGRTIEFTIAFPPGVAARLAGQLRVRTDLLEGKVGNFMTVELRGSSSSEVTDVVNAIAERFVVVVTDLQRRKLSELMNILGEQVEHSQRNLAGAEQALRDFRVRAVTVLSNEPAPVFTGGASARDPAYANFFELKASREQIRRDRIELNRVLAQAADTGLATDALETIGSVQHSSALVQALRELTNKQAELRALRSRYSDEHVPVRRIAADIATLERRTIPLLVQGLIAQLAAREAEQGRQVDSVAGGLRRIPPLAIEEGRLQRDVTIAEQLFANIRQRYEEARLAEVSSISEVRILDRAVRPEAPLFNAKPLLIALAFLGSCFAGVLGVVVLDHLDPRVRYPAQVTRTMGLTILGVVPSVKRRNGSATPDGIAPVIEALRGVRLRVVHAHGAPGPVVVTVTSPGRGDGKSFVTSNLALAFADAGYRTLLIDGDIRRGTLHRVLKKNRRPGLTELLAGEASREQVVQPAGYPSLWFIGCGARTHTGPELLASAPMSQLLTSLRSDYDAILVDSPPLAAGVDAFALGTMTGALVLVLRAGVSNRDLAEAKLDVLGRLPVRVLGAVLNDARLEGDYRYYSYYLAGYELVGEEPSWAGRPVLRESE